MRLPPVLRTMAVAPGTEWSTGWSSASIPPTANGFPVQTVLTGLGMYSVSTLGLSGKNADLPSLAIDRLLMLMTSVPNLSALSSSAVSMTAFVVSEQNTGTLFVEHRDVLEVVHVGM